MNNKKGRLLVVFILILSLFVTGCASESSSNSETTDAKATEAAVTATTTDDAITSDSAVTEDAIDEAKDSSKEDAKDSKKESSKDTKKSKKNTSKTDSSNSNNSSTAESKTISVTISIDCQTLQKADPDLAQKVSTNGTILGKKTIKLNKNSTVLDALKNTGISFTGSNYISKINGLSEKDGGKKSGWIYKVNGTAPKDSCDNYVLKDGDNIQWRYTLDSGNDV